MQMNLKSLTRYSSIISLSLFLVSCSNNNTTDNETVAGSDTAQTKTKNTKAQEVFYSIPSPIETISLLKAAGAKYNASYLNPIENVSKYTSVTSKALNLGTYGSDLSFTSMFDQTQESMLYLRCANKLAAGLGINGAFNETTASRLESNVQNRDSLLAIISDSYWTTDAYLKDNGQPGVSALVVAGGWIEGLYIGTQIANATQNKDVITRIGEQKLSLENLIALLESYKADNAGITAVLTSLNELRDIFNTIPTPTSETETVTDKKNNVTILDNKSTYSMTPEKLKEITDKVTQIRTKIIQ
jgi:PBP1b-binding outer membrane lipoprotein LpoB